MRREYDKLKLVFDKELKHIKKEHKALKDQSITYKRIIEKLVRYIIEFEQQRSSMDMRTIFSTQLTKS